MVQQEAAPAATANANAGGPPPAAAEDGQPGTSDARVTAHS